MDTHVFVFVAFLTGVWPLTTRPRMGGITFPAEANTTEDGYPLRSRMPRVANKKIVTAVEEYVVSTAKLAWLDRSVFSLPEVLSSSPSHVSVIRPSFFLFFKSTLQFFLVLRKKMPPSLRLSSL